MPKSPPVQILLGPARSHKAAALRRHYLDLIAAGTDPARILYLVPTSARRAATIYALLRESPAGVLRQPEIFTFPRYAQRILDLLATPARRLAPLHERALLAAAIEDCRAAGRLRYFLPILDRPGLLDSLADFIRQLKTHSVRPDDFALQVRSAAPALADAAAIYARYQARLAERDLYDDAGLFWQARDALAAAGPAFPWPAHVLVDGFHDFTAPQRDVLRALADRAELLITLTCDPVRPALFAPVLHTLDQLKKVFHSVVVSPLLMKPPALLGDAVSSVVVESPDSSVLAALEQHLFDPADSSSGACATVGSSDRVLSFATAAGRTREVEHLARTIRCLLRDDPALRPCDFAVILRAPDPYAELIAEIFPRYGLPLTGAPGRPLLRLPLVRWLVELLKLPASDFNYADLAAVLRSPYFPRDFFDARDAGLQTADRLLHRLNVFSGPDHHLRAISAFIDRAAARAVEAEDDDQPRLDLEAARGALALLRRLFAWAAALPSRATRADYAAFLTRTLDQFALEQNLVLADDLALTRRDLAALETLRDLLDQFSALADLAADQPVALADFVAELESAASAAVVAPPPPFGRGVHLLDVWSSRALTFRVVLLPGLADGLWPAPPPAHLLQAHDDRGLLQVAGLQLPSRAEHLAQERFLFYMALTRASDRLIFTRPASDEDGRPLVASRFWDELVRLAATDPENLPVHSVSARDADLPFPDAANLDELRRLALKAASGDELLPALSTLDPVLPAILDSAAVEIERESLRPFGPFDGCLSDPVHLADYPGDETLAVTRLENYTQCPFLFFARSLLDLDAWQPPQELFLPADVGLIYHDILRDFYRARAARGPDATRLDQASLAELRADLTAAIDLAFARSETSGSAALWQIQKSEVRDRLLAWLDAEIDRVSHSPIPIRPRYFEWAFGGRAGPAADPASTSDPLLISFPDGPGEIIRLRGRIDRLDELLLDHRARAFAVVDYKSGAKPAGLAADLDAGRLLQPQLYLLAACRLLDGREAADGQALYWYLRTLETVAAVDFCAGDKEAEKAARRLALAEDSVRETVRQCRRGFFPPVPAAGCSEHCDYVDLCRTTAWRVELKSREDSPCP
jgi:ATP-dependent helicase/DNAse subunit B